ncbi:LOB domain-containing protein 33 [Dorcoceras hygrometricum]|uniref:LOB domain-containing protein 33 n=1 Tax=Dorcoceras hygrometricum TaxID=472368 RepID=A0A2Z7DIA0_9LAMI|nr:LOB domain-containing protein 33 [Dorcoceras hygrometricum]
MHDPIYGCVSHIFALQQQVASIKEEIEMVGNQMANLGFDMAGITLPRQTDHPYLGCESIDDHGVSLHSFPISNSGHEFMDQAVCFSHVGTGTENDSAHAYFNSSILESLLEELNQDYYMAEEFSAMNGR